MSDQNTPVSVPETPEQVVARIEAIPAEERTKAQQSMLNRASWRIARDARQAEIDRVAKAKKAGEVKQAVDPVVVAPATGVSPPSRARDEPESHDPASIGPCPDPMDPGFPRALYVAACKRAWAALRASDTSDAQVISILKSAAKMAGVGDEDAKQPADLGRVSHLDGSEIKPSVTDRPKRDAKGT